MIFKPYIVSDKNYFSTNIKKKIKQKITVTSLSKSNLILVLGGDGFMLQTLKKFYKYKKPFYGINTGTYGFLMNKFSEKKFHENLNSAKPIIINPLEMIVQTTNNIIKKQIAINEISILRQSKQACSISLKINKKNIIKNLTSDGILVSTPAGSTAYNFSAHGIILELNSNKLAVTPINPFRPRRLSGFVIRKESTVTITNLNFVKRPFSAFADNFTVRNVKKVKIKNSNKIKFKIFYNKNNSLEKKIKLEKSKKEKK